MSSVDSQRLRNASRALSHTPSVFTRSFASAHTLAHDALLRGGRFARPRPSAPRRRAPLVRRFDVRHQRADVREPRPASRTHLPRPPPASPPDARAPIPPSPRVLRLGVRDERREVREAPTARVADLPRRRRDRTTRRRRRGRRLRRRRVRAADDGNAPRAPTRVRVRSTPPGRADADRHRAIDDASVRFDRWVPGGSTVRRRRARRRRRGESAAKVRLRESVLQAHLRAARLAPVRVHGDEFFSASRDGAPRRHRRVLRGVASGRRRVPVEGDVDVFARDVLHARAAERAHDARHRGGRGGGGAPVARAVLEAEGPAAVFALER